MPHCCRYQQCACGQIACMAVPAGMRSHSAHSFRLGEGLALPTAPPHPQALHSHTSLVVAMAVADHQLVVGDKAGESNCGDAQAWQRVPQAQIVVQHRVLAPGLKALPLEPHAGGCS